MKIAVDAMGGDYAPKVVIEGVVQAVREFGCHVILTGIEDRIKQELKKIKNCPAGIEILHTSEVVGMDEPATVSIRKKRDSSISRGIELVKLGKADAFFSAGNTGAVVCAATFGLGMIASVERPGISIIIPTLKRTPSLIIDVGANIDPKPLHLVHYAAMAAAYYRHIFKSDNPTVGLLNIGEEEAKGTDFVKETHQLLSDSHLNFIGNVEGKDLFKGKAEIIICDGFAGNVALKVSEGVIEVLGEFLKRELMASLMAKIGLFFIYNSLKRMKKNLDYAEYGGAPLLGINGVVIIGHGRSSVKAVKNAIRAAIKEIENNVNDRIGEAVKSLNIKAG